MSKSVVRRAVRFLLSLVLLLILGLAGWGCRGAGQNGDSGNGAGELTLEQKVGQLFMVGFDGTTLTPAVEDLLTTLHPGGVILFSRNVEDAGQLRQLTADLQKAATQDGGLPLFIAIDQEGGQVVRINWIGDTVQQSQVTDSAQAYDIGLARGQALVELGVNLNLAPVLDISAPGDFLARYGRTFLGGLEAVGNLGRNVIAGQIDGGVLSTAKHFPGYGGIFANPETENIPLLESVPETGQFRIAAQAHPDFVMTSSVIYTDIDPSLPFSLSPAGLAFLRQQIPGDYLVITDDLSTQALTARFTLPAMAVMAVTAGTDILLISSNQAREPIAAYEKLLESARSGGVSSADIDEKASRIQALKKRIFP